VLKLELAEAWSRGLAEDPHVGSTMLAPEMLPAVGIFCLLESGYGVVWQKGDSLFGVEASNAAEWLESNSL
jgi:hypothetical protein